MTNQDEQPTSRGPASDTVEVEALVAACIEALEAGEVAPTERVCADHPELIVRVQRRLAQLAQRGLIRATDPLLPASIGPYRVLKTLGSGGMGTVYLVEQHEPVRRHVALKVVKLGMDTREVVSRFQAERQALALMNHPNIAQVFEAGITVEGRPYFAMEYVDGECLTTICDQRALDVEARVRLFATVCRAVQHAHDRGFIHRDLKPSNVLVVAHEGQLVPKIIDFGIAKATAIAVAEAATRAENLHTRADQILGTPEYMSPEQALSGGVDVDARSDVYSLGVTLYELLCGELPFASHRLRGGGRGEMERILRDELPTVPSKRLSAVEVGIVDARGGERSTVCRTVSGELDWITLRALAKSRELRYPSPLALAEDLERWLQHVPVLAAPPGRTYRLRKFVRRHRVAVTAAALVATSLVAGLVVSLDATWRAREAALREATALASMRSFYGLTRDAIGNLVSIADERLADVPQAEPVRRQMLADAMHYYDSLRQREPGDLELRIDIAVASQRVGSLQERLGQITDAVATLQHTDAEVEALLFEAAEDPRLTALSIETPAALADACTRAGRGDDARAARQRALQAVQRERQRDNPTGLRLDNLEAGLLTNVAIDTDDPGTAGTLFARALAAHARIAAPTSKERRDHARCLGVFAENLTRRGRLDEAAQALGEAVRLAPVGGDVSVAWREAAAKLQDQFARVLRRLGRGDDASAAQRRGLELYTALADEHPDVPEFADAQAGALHLLAQLADDDGRLTEAIEWMGRAVAIRDRLADRQPQDYRMRVRSVRSLMTKAAFEVEAWQHHGAARAAAEATLAVATQRIDAIDAEHGDDAEVLATFAAVHQSNASLRNASGDRAGAIREYHVVRDLLASRLPTWADDVELHYQLAMVGSNLLQAHILDRDPEAAIAAGDQAMTHLRRGLQLDARHAGLHEMTAALVARVSYAHFANGDADGGFAALAAMLDDQRWCQDAVETSLLLLAQRLGDDSAPDIEARRTALLPRVLAALREAIARRGAFERALERPVQARGVSHVESRLRDLDLRLVLADFPGDVLAPAEVRLALDEARRVADGIPDLEASRLRNLCGSRAEFALREGRVADAVEDVEYLLQRIGKEGGGCYMAAVLLAQGSARADDAELRERAAARAVECLRHALDAGEVPREALRHPNLEPLRAREDYLALLRR